MVRPVPAECEFQERGDVPGLSFGKAVHCHKTPKRAASANGLSPIFVCDDHGRRFRNRWRDHLDDVRSDPL